MNTYYIKLSLIFLISLPGYISPKGINSAKPPVMVSELLKFIDAMGTVNISSMLKFGQTLREFQVGEKHKNKPEPVGLIPFQGRRITLKQAAELERTAQQESNQRNQELLATAFADAVDILEEFSSKHLASLEAKKREISEIIELWSATMHRQDSPLRLLAASNHLSINNFLRQNVSNLQELWVFTSDLSNFLAVFIQSLPISYQNHLATIKKP
jgi:hypothetical protein